MSTDTISSVADLAPAQDRPVARGSRPLRPAIDLSRLGCVDLLRGLAMILMALDHARGFFSGAGFAPENITHTTGALFFTRWITHFCAPIFFLLAGTGGYLALSRGKSVSQVSRFFWTRGLWLVFLNLTVMAFAWTSLFPFLFSGVLWSLGWSMVVMAVLIRLPLPAIAAFGTVIVFTHNLLDHVNPAVFGKFSGLWLLLHGYGTFWIIPGKLDFFVLWPLLPWVGVMALGYVLGSLFQQRDWTKIVFRLGAASTALFLLLRVFNLYGNSSQNLFGVAAGPWQVQPTLALTIASFFNCLKYPASLQFLLMTLGPSLMALAWLSTIHAESPLTKLVAVFGRVPLFYYVLHLFVIRTLAVYIALIFKQKAAWLLHGGFMVQEPPPGYGHSLLFIYAMWFAAVLFMYPLCLGFMKLKQHHADWWWLRYL
ncbi:MAG: DUF1624 domain-containing protein [Candidatus Acidiferrales bacterium]